MAPVFSLVLDRDVSEDTALMYPELYKELTKVCPCRRARLTKPGPRFELQDLLHVAHDQCVPRWHHHAPVTVPFRDGVFAHRCHLVHSTGAQ